MWMLVVVATWILLGVAALKVVLNNARHQKDIGTLKPDPFTHIRQITLL